MVAQGWCPSTYRIHEAPDGGLARVKVPGGVLSTDQLRAAADAARRFGNATVELTSRANLQLRGVDPAHAAALRAVLAPVGLSGPTAEAEDRRNVLASPAAGLDRGELIDLRPVVAEVVAALDALPAGLALPHKVGVLLDGGGAPTLRGLTMDVALGAVRTGDGSVVFEVAMGGALAVAPHDDPVAVAPGDVPRLVTAAAHACAAPPDGGVPRRMADVVAACGRDRVLEALGGAVALLPLRTPGGSGPPGSAWGVATGPDGAPVWVGVGPANSPPDADAIDRLAGAVEAAGGDEVRLTPWRSVLVPVTGSAAGRTADWADALVDQLDGAGWTAEPAWLAARPVGARA